MSTRKPAPDTAVTEVDTSYLESLVGYNARRATLVIVDAFLRNMAVYGLRPVDFSMLSLIAHNPGITSRQLCTALNIQPPNLVGMINQLQTRELIVRRPHPHDGRAMGLHLTPEQQQQVSDWMAIHSSPETPTEPETKDVLCS